MFRVDANLYFGYCSGGRQNSLWAILPAAGKIVNCLFVRRIPFCGNRRLSKFVGRSFSNIRDFEEALKKYEENANVQMYRRHTRGLESYQKRKKTAPPIEIPEQLVITCNS